MYGTFCKRWLTQRCIIETDVALQLLDSFINRNEREKGKKEEKKDIVVPAALSRNKKFSPSQARFPVCN